MTPRQLFLLLSLLLCPLPAVAATVVTLQPLDTLIFYPQQEVPATVVSLNDSLLSLEVTGIIATIPVQVGQRVEKGTTLLSLDPWSYQNQLQQAQGALEESQSRLELAQRQQERTAQLRKNGQASAEQFDQRATELKTLVAQIEQQQALLHAARERLQRVVLRAPFAGVVSDRTAQVGAYAAPGMPLLRLTDTEHLELSAQIRPDQAVQFDATWQGHFMLGEQRYPLQWRTLVAIQSAQTRTQEVRLLLTGAQKPPPGAVGRLVWLASRPHIPGWILSRRAGSLGLFLAAGEKARFQPLPQAIEGQPTPITEEIQGNVILSGREKLNDGDAIQLELTP